MGERTRCSVEIARRASARAVELGRRAANGPIIAETAFGGSRVTASSNHPRFVRSCIRVGGLLLLCTGVPCTLSVQNKEIIAVPLVMLRKKSIQYRIMECTEYSVV